MMDGFRATLEKAHLTMQDLVYVQIFCSDMSLFDRFNAVSIARILAEPAAGARVYWSGRCCSGDFEIQGICDERRE